MMLQEILKVRATCLSSLVALVCVSWSFFVDLCRAMKRLGHTNIKKIIFCNRNFSSYRSKVHSFSRLRAFNDSLRAQQRFSFVGGLPSSWSCPLNDRRQMSSNRSASLSATLRRTRRPPLQRRKRHRGRSEAKR